jgi:hypothetical protein
MGKDYYDRYQSFKVDGKYLPLPFIKIPPKGSDKTVVYTSSRTRLDKQYGGVEDNIPDKEIIRIPFPFRDSLQQYIDEVEKYKRLYIKQ